MALWDTLERWDRIISLVSRNAAGTEAELASTLNVTVKTIKRDIANINEMVRMKMFASLAHEITQNSTNRKLELKK